MNRRDFFKAIGIPALVLPFVKLFPVNKPNIRVEEWTVWDNKFYKIYRFSPDGELEWASINGEIQYFSSSRKSPGVLFENGIAKTLGFQQLESRSLKSP